MSVQAIELQDATRLPALVFPRHGPRSLKCTELSIPSVSFQPRAPPKSPGPEPAPAPLAHGWLVPAGYACCGLVLGLCNLVAPYAIVPCAHILCPVWSCTLLLHAAALQGPWLWWGLVALLVLPFILALADPLFTGFYVLAFLGFAAGRFWDFMHGPGFLLVCLACLSACASLSLALVVGRQPVHLALAVFSALVAAFLCTLRLARVQFLVA